MPKWPVHHYLDWTYLGREYPKIHRAMDAPVRYLGRSHRVLFHDLASAIAIAEYCYPGDPDAVFAACNHIHYDELCSRDPEHKRLLEKMELLSRKERKKARAARKKAEREMKKDPVLGRFLEDTKKLKELGRLWRYFNP